jgi:hypothetical protein
MLIVRIRIGKNIFNRGELVASWRSGSPTPAPPFAGVCAVNTGAPAYAGGRPCRMSPRTGGDRKVRRSSDKVSGSMRFQGMSERKRASGQ